MKLCKDCITYAICRSDMLDYLRNPPDKIKMISSNVVNAYLNIIQPKCKNIGESNLIKGSHIVKMPLSKAIKVQLNISKKDFK